MSDDQLTHAGGVVRREVTGESQFLLVRAKPAPHDWVLPKGHIETGETPDVTARREVAEEAGVVADVGRSLGDVSFEARGRVVHVRYFVMQYRADTPATEQREVRWCSLAECERLLRFESALALVRSAAQTSALPGS
jgi:8-oxo-dGTP pyrophosphatase MutT (NUDIX family)